MKKTCLGFFCSLKPSSKLNHFVAQTFLLVWLLLATAFPARAQAPSLSWSNNIGARAFALDGLNNVYASAGNQIIVLNSAGVAQSTNVICPLPGIVKRDAAGNLYFGGNFDGTQNFGGITLTGGCTNCAFGHYGPGWPSCYLAKYSSGGTLQWVTSLGINSYSNRVTDLALNTDGSITVGYDASGVGTLGMFSPTGSNLWTKVLPGSNLGDNMSMKVGSFDGTSGSFLQYRFSGFIRGGFYDSAGNLTTSIAFPPPVWGSPLTGNAEPSTGPTNTTYIAGLSSDTLLPQLQKWSTGGSLVWTQSLGSIEQYILGGDSGGNLYLAGTNGLFSKYDASGSLLWSTNYGTAIEALQTDGAGNGIVSFSNGAVARFGAPPVSSAYQAPALVWTTALGAKPFALDDQNNVYASISNKIIVLNAAGIPQQTNSYCPLPGVVQRDSGGNFYYGGSFDGTQNFGGITLVGGCQNCSLGHYAPGWPSCYLAKYSSNGTLQWATAFSVNSSFNRVTDLALNPDGTITVGYDTSGLASLAMFSASGSNIWSKGLMSSSFGDSMAMKVSTFDGHYGSFLEIRYSGSMIGGFYDAAGNTPFYTLGPPLLWGSSACTNAVAVSGPTNTAFLASLALETAQPQLQKLSTNGVIIWMQPIGGMEQFIVGADAAANLYLSATNGLFSKYDANGNFMWSTNYGAVVTSMLLDNLGSGILSFANGSFSRFGTSGTRPQLVATRNPNSSGFHFRIVGNPQSVFQIFESTDLSHWDSLSSVTNVSGQFDFADTNSTSQVRKFYKAVLVQ
ncbi:hypothetical protein [Pedosphaera parvula]|uniref:Uncharacterized protein n=1 Tax=Pedosphaera parvula (strain Ellin514) TaxID=320771 RepID=B9X9W0_PEDPL|nr:hypothetical protein [Pedosphaera parvula]EEF63301.1 hypothetical protein Cflav_PD5936 [Pedosphaera parvula Ellin514]